MAAIGTAWVDGAWIEASWVVGAWSQAVAVSLEGNIIFGQRYSMIHPPQEDMLRPTSITEFTIRKRDKRPIITGGDH